MASAASAASKDAEIELSSEISIDTLDETGIDLPLLSAAARYVVRTGHDLVLDDALADATFGNDPYVQQNKIRSVLCMLLKYQGQIIAVLYLENNLSAGAFTEERLELLNLLSGQMAVAIKNAQYFEDVLRINRAYERFVPKQFLDILGRESIVDVQLGDQVSRDMTVMFLDIRDFTKLSESMSPEENFNFINGFLQAVEPQVSRHGGIIDKYNGDGLMALFPNSADDAVRSGIDIVAALKVFNGRRADTGAAPIKIGIGLHSGRLMLGTIGGQNRMDGTVISAAVNQASRIEGLNRECGSQILVSASTVDLLYDPDVYENRWIGRFKVKGGIDVSVYEIFHGDPPERIALKRATRDLLSKAATDMEAGNTQAARDGFEALLRRDPHDRLALYFQDKLSMLTANHDKAS